MVEGNIDMQQISGFWPAYFPDQPTLNRNAKLAFKRVRRWQATKRTRIA